jgi:hypothetical protein
MRSRGNAAPGRATAGTHAPPLPCRQGRGHPRTIRLCEAGTGGGFEASATKCRCPAVLISQCCAALPGGGGRQERREAAAPAPAGGGGQRRPPARGLRAGAPGLDGDPALTVVVRGQEFKDGLQKRIRELLHRAALHPRGQVAQHRAAIGEGGGGGGRAPESFNFTSPCPPGGRRRNARAQCALRSACTHISGQQRSWHTREQISWLRSMRVSMIMTADQTVQWAICKEDQTAVAEAAQAGSQVHRQTAKGCA